MLILSECFSGTDTLVIGDFYRVVHLFVDLGWVDFELSVPPSCPSAQPLLPNSHQAIQNWADSGTLKIQVSLTSPRPDESPYAEFSFPSFIEVVRLSFREFPQLVGRYCS